MKARILVCDDDANMRDSVQDNLEDEGYEVVLAATGGAAVEAVEKTFFDVILMDYQLPDGTGIEVIKRIRERNQESQILMLTGHGTSDVSSQSVKESVYGFMIKPVGMPVLKDVIGKAVEKLRLQQENRRLMEEISRLSDMKSKFMSMSSHDLSNALMTLQVSFEMLSGTLTPNDEQKKRMAYISSGISQIRRLVEDLVDWASIEQGKFRLERDWFAPDALVDEIVIGPQGRASARGISLTTRVGGAIPKLYADRRRISQVINNLLENAIRHTLRGGAVVLSVEASGGDIVFAVRDTGEGIAPEDHQKIFLSFCQGSSQQKERGRLGLGLSISREIVQNHGGSINVESPGPGKGSVFSFRIPMAAPPQ